MNNMSQICDQLRQAILKGKKSRYKLWQETGIEQAALSRFMSSKTGLNIETLEQLAPALGFELVLRKKKKTLRRKGR